MAVRPQGAGAQLLLLSLCVDARLSYDGLPVVAPAVPDRLRHRAGNPGRARRVRHRDAPAANAAGVDFVPIVWERFDVAMRQRDYFRPPLQAFLGFLRHRCLLSRAGELGGYDVSDAGAVRHAP